MIALMIILALCTVARGAEVVSCRREGLMWVRHDGTQVRSNLFNPARVVGSLGPQLLKAVKGFLILFPARKNKQSTPTWIPVISPMAIQMLAFHLDWLDRTRGVSHGCLFPARVLARRARRRVYNPAKNPESAMSVNSLRLLMRQALVDCCQLTQAQSAQYGTHSFRVGAVEFLRRKGVPAEARQQLGGWMSADTALGYLQLPVSAQFNVLRKIFD